MGIGPRRGTTVLETVVVVALVAVTVGAAWFVVRSGRATEGRLEREQEFERLEARLHAAVKRDLRSAVDLRCVAADRYDLQVLGDGESGEGPVVTAVTWTTNHGGRVVRRQTGERTETFDMRPWMDGDTYVFEIVR